MEPLATTPEHPLLTRGEYQEALSHFTVACREAAERGDAEAERAARRGLATAAYALGDLNLAREEARAAGAPALEAAVEAQAGRLALAEERWAEAAANPAEADYPYRLEILLALGRPDEAEALALTLAGQVDAATLGWVDALRAEAIGRLGRTEEGIRLAEETLHAATASEAKGVALRASGIRAMLALTGEDWEAAQHAAEEAIGLAGALGCRLELIRLYGVLGEAALGRGATNAQKHFMLMAGQAEALGASLLLARAIFGLAAAQPTQMPAPRVAEAQRLVRLASVGLSSTAEERFRQLPEMARILAGNHVAFGRSRRKRSVTGPVGFAPRTLGW